MRKNISVILLSAAILVFMGTVNKGAKADVDPVDLIKNAKTPVYLHSLAGGDSLVHEEPTQVDNWWMSVYPSNTYPHVWHVIDEKDNGIPGLNPLDKLKLQHVATGNWVWVDVLEVTKTLILTLEPLHEDTMYIEYTGGYDSLMNPLTDPDYHPVCTWWHEIWPEFCRIYHLSSWVDTDGGGYLSYCDTIDLTEYWHVVSVTEEAGQLWLTLEDLEGGAVQNRRLTFSGGIDPDSVYRALHDPVCTWWHEEEPDYCNWWHIDSWSARLDSCDTLDMVRGQQRWHVLNKLYAANHCSLYLDLGNRRKYLKSQADGFEDSCDYFGQHPVCTWWHEIKGTDTTRWHIINWIDNGSTTLDFCDTIDIVAPEKEWFHVKSVDRLNAELTLTNQATLEEMIVRIHPDSLDTALKHPVCTWWHEEHPDTCTWWHIASWSRILRACDTIDFKTWWHVQDVAIDIEVHSIDPPDKIPTMTPWGLIVLVALLITSAIYIVLRKRRVSVSP